MCTFCVVAMYNGRLTRLPRFSGSEATKLRVAMAGRTDGRSGFSKIQGKQIYPPFLSCSNGDAIQTMRSGGSAGRTGRKENWR